QGGPRRRARVPDSSPEVEFPAQADGEVRGAALHPLVAEVVIANRRVDRWKTRRSQNGQLSPRLQHSRGCNLYVEVVGERFLDQFRKLLVLDQVPPSEFAEAA